MRIYNLILLTVTVGLALPLSAAITKTVPNEITPEKRALFFGEAHFITVPGSLELKQEGSLKTAFLQRKVRWSRTGEIATDAQIAGNWGPIDIPAGSRLYAMPFKDGFISHQKSLEERGIAQPEVAWCTPDVNPKKGRPFCFFIDLSGTVLSATSRAGSRFYPEYMGISAMGSDIIVPPEILEKDVDFKTELTIELQITKIRKRKLSYQVDLFDGTKRSRIYWSKTDRAEDGSAVISLWGGELKIIPTGKKTFRIEETQPLKENVSKDEELMVPPYALRA